MTHWFTHLSNLERFGVAALFVVGALWIGYIIQCTVGALRLHADGKKRDREAMKEAAQRANERGYNFEHFDEWD